MRLIILLEKQNAGKSTTIGEIYKKLRKKVKPFKEKSPKRKKDKLAIFKFKKKVIGICCKGDGPIEIQNDFYWLFSNLKNKKMDILICSSRNNDEYALLNLKAVMDFINYNKINNKNSKKNVIEIVSLDSIKYCSDNKNKKIPKDVAEKIYNSILLN